MALEFWYQKQETNFFIYIYNIHTLTNYISGGCVGGCGEFSWRSAFWWWLLQLIFTQLNDRVVLLTKHYRTGRFVPHSLFA